jgi:hypothetical protein
MTFQRTVSAEIEAHIERVYALVSDIRRHPDWAHNELQVEHAAGPEMGLGAEYSCMIERPAPGMNKPARGSIRVIEAAAPYRFSYECHDDAGYYRWTFDLSSSGRGTTVHHTVRRLSAPAHVRLVQPVAWRAFGDSQVRGGLDKLAQLAQRPPMIPPQATAPTAERATRVASG